jgi:hypothetical protein
MMRSLSYTALIVLVGCASAQPPSMPPSTTIGGAVAPPQGAKQDGQRAARTKDWDLLYVSNAVATVTVYRYWQQRFYMTLTGFATPKGECVDQAGDVFITDSTLHEVFEYAHGGTTPIKTISDAGFQPYACAVDLATGKLAIANFENASGSQGNVAVYKHASGKPQLYDPNLDGYGPLSCAYDDKGDLMIATEYPLGSYEHAAFAMLPRSDTRFEKVGLAYIKKSPNQDATNVQWDGKYWAITDNGNISRFIIQKLIKKYEGTTTLSGNADTPGQVWIAGVPGSHSKEGTRVVAAESDTVLYWKYPAGGDAYASISDYLDAPYGVTVSPKIAGGSGNR